MNNLSLREKAIIYILFLVVIALLAYLFGIRTLNNANADMQIQLQELQARKEQLDVLKQENQKTQGAIETLKSDIVKYEQSFISEMKTENLEKYVLDEFEKAGMPFLADVKSEDVQMEAIVLADGTSSNDSVNCKRIIAKYATTDGYEITQYNLNESNYDENGNPRTSYLKDMLNKTGVYNEENRYGYQEFIKALATMEKADPDCVKITKIGAESTHGYLTLTAAIDFYGTTLTNRQSQESDAHKAKFYGVWNGDGVDTKGGFIGMPYKVDNPDSLWNGILIDSNEINGFIERPFAAYLSNARFTQLLSEKGLEKIVGGGIVAADSDKVPEPTPAPDDAA